MTSNQNLSVESAVLPNADVDSVDMEVVRQLLEDERCTASIDEIQFVSLWSEGRREGEGGRGEWREGEGKR